MSRKGNCWDNAPIESCRGSLKTELVHHRRFITREQAKREITEYIEVFYNRMRKQARLGFLSPAAFTQQYYANQLAA
jgi:putative transposase